MSNAGTPLQDVEFEEASTVDLVRDAVDEAKELVRIELEMLKSELGRQIEQAKKAAVAVGVAVGASIVVINMLAVAVVLAVGATALAALALAGAFLVVGGAAAIAGYALMPKKPLEQTRHRIESDSHRLGLRERVA